MSLLGTCPYKNDKKKTAPEEFNCYITTLTVIFPKNREKSVAVKFSIFIATPPTLLRFPKVRTCPHFLYTLTTKTWTKIRTKLFSLSCEVTFFVCLTFPNICSTGK